jgi:hypothetical protein
MMAPFPATKEVLGLEKTQMTCRLVVELPLFVPFIYRPMSAPSVAFAGRQSEPDMCVSYPAYAETTAMKNTPTRVEAALTLDSRVQAIDYLSCVVDEDVLVRSEEGTGAPPTCRIPQEDIGGAPEHR